MADGYLKDADWQRLEKDVVNSIRTLRAICNSLPKNEMSKKIIDDLVVPNLRLLGEFCVNVDLGK